MARKLSILGILVLFAAASASASTFLQFAQNPGTPTSLIITDTPASGLVSGYTTIALTNALILWDMPNTLGGGMRAGLLTFNASTEEFAVGDIPGNKLVETGFTGTGSIYDYVDGHPGNPVMSLTFSSDDTTTLTVANGSHTGTFVDSSPLHVVAAPYLT